jgi:hypothetical protein
MQGTGRQVEAGSVAFTSVVVTQLAQTLEVGRVEGTLSPSVVVAVAGSLAVLLSTVALPPLRNLLGLQMPSPFGWSAVATAAAGAVVISKAISALTSAFEADREDAQSPLLHQPIIPAAVPIG